METYDAILTRRSTPVTGPEPPTRAQIERLLDAAVAAPTHHRTQPWRFIVLTGDVRTELGAVFAEHARRAGGNPAAAERLPISAPTIIVVVERAGRDHHVPVMDEHYAVGAAMQNILLAAHDAGLATMIRTGSYATSDLVRDHLGVKPDEAIAGFISVGSRPAGYAPRLPQRTPATELTEWRDAGGASTTVR